MEKVKAEVVTHYRSELVEYLRANGCSFAYGNTGIRLAKEFGFCYGVERAIDLAYAARRHFPREQPVYILGEIIHNPHVNEQIRDMGITFLSGDHQGGVVPTTILQASDCRQYACALGVSQQKCCFVP